MEDNEKTNRTGSGDEAVTTGSDVLFSESMYREIVESSQDLIWQCDTEGRYVFLNKAWEKVFGYRVDEMLGRRFTDFMSPMQAEEDLDTFRRLLDEDTVQEYETCHLHRDGHPVWLSFNAMYVQAADGSILGTRGIAYDITARKQAEADLAESRRRYREMVMRSPMGMHFYELDGERLVFTDFNPAAERLLGVSNRRFVGKTIEEAFPPLAKTEIPARYRAAAAEGVAWQTEQIAYEDNRVCGAFEVHAFQIEKNKMVAVFSDISRRKRAETNQKLESLGVLAGGIAHDFNNLLGGIFGYIDLAGAMSDRAEVKDYLEKAFLTMERARGLTEQLLTFSKGGHPVLQVLNPGPIVERAARFMMRGNSIALHFEISEDLRSCRIDENQFAQVVDNLVINAQQAMPTGGQLTVTAENISFSKGTHPILPQGDYVRITVADTGAGIPLEILPNIFDPFFTTKQTGSGLGLTIAHSIVLRHDGALDVASTVGAGTVFTIHLPVAESDLTAESPASEENAVETSKESAVHFLIMDDEDYIREVLGVILETLGYTVTAVESGEQAVDALRGESSENRFAAAILDLTVPGGMGGKETAERLREIRNDLPIFLASGYSDDPVIADPAAFGFSGSFCKPYRLQDIEVVLEQFFSNKKEA